MKAPSTARALGRRRRGLIPRLPSSRLVIEYDPDRIGQFAQRAEVLENRVQHPFEPSHNFNTWLGFPGTPPN